MQNILNTRQSIFINDSLNAVQRANRDTANKVDKDSAFEPSSTKRVLEGQLVKRGEADNFAQADDIFERAEYFRSLPSSVKHGLEAYTSIDKELQREQIKTMMGVDLYA